MNTHKVPLVETIKKYDFKAGLPIEFELVSLSSLFAQSRKALTSPHRTAFYQIIWFQTGTPTHLTDFNPVAIQPNTVLFLNKDSVQVFDPGTPFEAQAILFTDTFFARSQEDTRFLRSTILFNDLLSVSKIQLNEKQPGLAQLFGLLKQEYESHQELFYSQVLRQYLHSFLLLAERERRKQNFVEITQGPNLDYTLLFKELVEDSYKQVKQVSQYADQLHLSEKRLHQATTKAVGKSPKAIIDERVVLEAKRLLAHSSESIKEIGYALGFQEPTNFIKYFRKHARLTPVAFREQFVA